MPWGNHHLAPGFLQEPPARLLAPVGDSHRPFFNVAPRVLTGNQSVHTCPPTPREAADLTPQDLLLRTQPKSCLPGPWTLDPGCRRIRHCASSPAGPPGVPRKRHHRTHLEDEKTEALGHKVQRAAPLGSRTVHGNQIRGRSSPLQHSICT